MDHIYPTKDYKEYVVKQDIEELRNVVEGNEMPRVFDDISKSLHITEEELRQKSLEICKLYEDYGRDKPCESSDDFSEFPEDALELNCVKFLRKENMNFKESRSKESHLLEKRKEINNENADIQVFRDSILTLRFYEPFKYAPNIKNHPRFQMEFVALGSNFLSQLRDIIYCSCNFGPFFDISEYPTATIIHNENTPNPGFLFIHDTFYNDTRNPDNPDYSDNIIKWMKRYHYTRELKSRSMEHTKFEDLKIRIGYPCVYQHHGACEHLFCITSVDLIDSSDSLKSSDYPKLTQVSNKREAFCEICNRTEAEYIVTDCPLHVKDPTKLCENCFFSFHYIDRTHKTCDFKAYKICSVNPINVKEAQSVPEQIEEFEIVENPPA